MIRRFNAGSPPWWMRMPEQRTRRWNRMIFSCSIANLRPDRTLDWIYFPVGSG